MSFSFHHAADDLLEPRHTDTEDTARNRASFAAYILDRRARLIPRQGTTAVKFAALHIKEMMRNR